MPNPNSVSHYENFPVASWLCPPRLRPAVAAIYWFARTADDIADEGDAPAVERLADLAQFQRDLDAVVAEPSSVSTRSPQVFAPLGSAIHSFRLPVDQLAALLSAFKQDVVQTRDAAGYANRDELLDYCSRSANPVGRLMLHLYGVTDAESIRQSDCICTALQLANFWQDLSLDIPRGRYYLNVADCASHGVASADWMAQRQTPELTRLIAEQVRWARTLMIEGAPLVHKVSGRAGWELRLVVQGGLRILDRIESLRFATLTHRPKLGARDAVVMLWRSLWM